MTYMMSFAVSMLFITFALLVWKASPNRVLNRRFTTYTLVAAGWATAVTAGHGGAHLWFWVPIGFAAGSLIPAAFVAFIHAYAPAEGMFARHLSRTLLALWVTTGIFFTVLS